MAAYLAAHSVVQYQMPRSQAQRFPLGSHCDSPGVLQLVPMAGREDTGEPMQVLVAPPVALPPVMSGPVVPVPPMLAPATPPVST